VWICIGRQSKQHNNVHYSRLALPARCERLHGASDAWLCASLPALAASIRKLLCSCLRSAGLQPSTALVRTAL